MTNPGLVVPFTTTLLGIVGVMGFTRMRQGSLLSPLSISLMMLVSIFGIRPILMVEVGDYSFYGSDTRVGFEVACWVGLAAVAGLVFGSLVGELTRSIDPPPAWRLSRRATDTYEGIISRGAIGATVLLLSWFAAMVYVGGGIGFVQVLFSGRSDEATMRLAGVPAIIPALPVAAALIMAVARIRTEAFRDLRPMETAQYWLVIAVAVVPPSALGTRRFLLPSIIAALIGAAARKWRRRLSGRMIALALGVFLALATIPFVRSAGSRRGSSDLVGAMVEYIQSEGMGGVFSQFFLSYDTEMFSYIAYLAPQLGKEIPFGLGRATLGDALLAPLPAAVAPFPSWSNHVLTLSFGGDCSTAYCPVASLPGTLYLDFGIPFVIIGMVVLGIAFTRFEQRFLTAGPISTTLLVVLAAFMTQIVRGNPISQLWIALQVWAVVAIMGRLTSGPVFERRLNKTSRARPGLPGRRDSLAPQVRRPRQ